MNRRNFLKTSIAGITAISFIKTKLLGENFQYPEVTTIKPRSLKKGDHVYLISPGTNTPEPESIAKAKEVCSWLGVKPVFSKSLQIGQGYRTRSADIRADELMSAFENNNIKGIFSMRGGYGSQQILDLLDYDLIRANPKIFTGYSDITALHLAINQFTGLITFHSPVMTSAFTKFTADNFRKIICGKCKRY